MKAPIETEVKGLGRKMEMNVKDNYVITEKEAREASKES